MPYLSQVIRFIYNKAICWGAKCEASDYAVLPSVRNKQQTHHHQKQQHGKLITTTTTTVESAIKVA